jgi:tRNA(fMet)-specific endonuclease VapC
MIQYLLDTDHFTLHELGHPALRQHLSAHPPDAIAISIVTAEESLRGRVALLAKLQDGTARIRAYAKLRDTIRFLNTIPIVGFDQPAEDQFQQLKSQKLRVGTRDLKIAAVALANNLIVVTRNRKDFGQVPGLQLEDWSIP